jgi:hypothetical protein
MKHTFTREQIKQIIVEELERSRDEDEAKELLRQIVGINEDEADEFEAKLKKARKFKNRGGLISLLAAVAILFGGMAGLTTSQKASIESDIEKVQQMDAETLASFGVDIDALEDPQASADARGSTYPTAELGLVDLEDMNNSQRVETAWKQIDDMVADGKLKYQRARVSTTLPGGMATLDYDAIPPNLVMPNSLGTKDQYRAWLVQNILKGDVKNLPDLRKFVYGNSGKWPSGSGEKRSRYVGKAQVLPPEWAVALDLYQETLTTIVDDVSSAYRKADDKGKRLILQANGVETPEQLEAAFNQLLYQAGLQQMDLK